MRIKTIIAVLLIAAACVTAKPKPAPKAIVIKKGPDLEAFAKAYEKAAEPTLLIICGVDAQGRVAPGQLQNQTATGNTAGQTFVGQNLSKWDFTGDAAKLKTDIETILLKNPDVELVDQASLSESQFRNSALSQAQSQNEYFRLLGTQVNADVVITIRMQRLNGLRGAQYRVLVSMLNVARGRKIGGFAFDWQTAAGDSRTIQRYASSITRRLIEDFCRYYESAGDVSEIDYSVRIIDVPDASTMAKIKRLIKKIDGVKKVRFRGQQTADGKSIANYKVTFAGESIELAAMMQEDIQKLLSKKVTVGDTTAGTIQLSLYNKASGFPLIDPDHPDHHAAAASFLSKYKAAGSPRIATCIVRQLSPRLESDREAIKSVGEGMTWGNLVTGGNTLVLIANPNLNPNPDFSALVNPASLESVIQKDLIRLKLNMVDSSYLFSKFERSSEAVKGIFNKSEMMYNAGEKADVDILLFGIIRVEPVVGGRYAIDYSLRAVNQADGSVLSSVTWTARSPIGAQIPGDFKILRIGRQMLSELLEQMQDSFKRTADNKPAVKKSQPTTQPA